MVYRHFHNTSNAPSSDPVTLTDSYKKHDGGEQPLIQAIYISLLNMTQKSAHISNASDMICASPKMLFINYITRSHKHYIFAYFITFSYVQAGAQKFPRILKIECNSSNLSGYFISYSPLFLTLLL